MGNSGLLARCRWEAMLGRRYQHSCGSGEWVSGERGTGRLGCHGGGVGRVVERLGIRSSGAVALTVKVKPEYPDARRVVLLQAAESPTGMVRLAGGPRCAGRTQKPACCLETRWREPSNRASERRQGSRTTPGLQTHSSCHAEAGTRRLRRAADKACRACGARQRGEQRPDAAAKAQAETESELGSQLCRRPSSWTEADVQRRPNARQ